MDNYSLSAGPRVRFVIMAGRVVCTLERTTHTPRAARAHDHVTGAVYQCQFGFPAR